MGKDGRDQASGGLLSEYHIIDSGGTGTHMGGTLGYLVGNLNKGKQIRILAARRRRMRGTTYEPV
jgi:hypothetical protein